MRALRWLAVVAAALSWQSSVGVAANNSQTVVVRDHRTQTSSTGPVIRDHRKPYVVSVPTTFPDKHKTPDASGAHGGVIVTKTPVNNDPRKPYTTTTGPIIRDHRNPTGPIIRDHRNPTGPIYVPNGPIYVPNGPIVVDHPNPSGPIICPPTQPTGPIVCDPKPPHGPVCDRPNPTGPVVCDPQGPATPTVPTGPIIRDHRHPTGPIIRDHRTPDASGASGGVIVTPGSTPRRTTSPSSSTKIVLPLPKLPIVIKL